MSQIAVLAICETLLGRAGHLLSHLARIPANAWTENNNSPVVKNVDLTHSKPAKLIPPPPQNSSVDWFHPPRPPQENSVPLFADFYHTFRADEAAYV